MAKVRKRAQEEQQQASAGRTAGAAPEQAAVDPRMLQMMQMMRGGMQPGMTGGAPQMGAMPPGMGQQPMMGGMAPPGMGAPGAQPGAMMQLMRQRMAQGKQLAGMQQGGYARPGAAQAGLSQGSRSGPQPINNNTGRRDDPVRMDGPAPVDKERIKEAMRVMLQYKDAKAMTDARIIKDQEWWRQHNWTMIEAERGTVGTQPVKTSTGWLKTSIAGKHADYMSAYPAPLFLARNAEDEAEAQHLTEIVPVVLAQACFDETYSDCGWQKLTEGTGVYAVTWDGQAQHGMGEIRIDKINALNVYAQPGIEDIQDSANVFIVRMEDNAKLEAMYPQLIGKLGRAEMRPKEYKPIDASDKSDKSLLVDWYYKKHNGRKQVLHYCKFCGDEVLYASENDQQMAQGYYHHGLYPFVLDGYLPDAGTIWAQGTIDMAYGTQADIDTMSQAMVTNTAANATPRYFERGDSGINIDEFMDWSRPIVHTNGNLGADSIARVEVPTMDGNALSFYTSKIEELKFVLGNTEVMNGDVPAGVTSGVAIAALKEDAGRQSMDSNRTTYRAMKRIYLMVVELIRQFYSMERQFRIVGEDGMVSYTSYSNARLQMQTEQDGFGVTYRMPTFDVDVHVQRENAYTRMAINDMATQFYQLGVFNPMQAPQALMMLQMMDFTGKERIVKMIQQNFMQTMTQMGGMAPAQQTQQGMQTDGEMKSTPTEDDRDLGQRNEQAHTPATDRMSQRVADAVRP